MGIFRSLNATPKLLLSSGRYCDSTPRSLANTSFLRPLVIVTSARFSKPRFGTPRSTRHVQILYISFSLTSSLENASLSACSSQHGSQYSLQCHSCGQHTCFMISPPRLCPIKMSGLGLFWTKTMSDKALQTIDLAYGPIPARLINLQDQQIFESWRGITGNAFHSHIDLRRYHFWLPLTDNHM